ncbi:MAG TPA: FAD-dependent oxidoreductase, partial [Acidimicrobiales bacterium]|nr:FAD-dependent oxidoreductase [Acidimicrobiales bacterium]
MTEGAPWDSEADVVVVGSGAAGLSAAVAAATKGASVTVLERAAHLGGTTAKSGGTVWIPNNGLMRSMGWDDPRSEALQYMVRLAFPHRYDPVDATLGIESERYEMIATFYDRADEALEALSSVGALQSVLDAETPSYHADLVEEAAPYGRSLKPADKPADQTHRTGGEVMIDRMAGVARGLGAEVLTDHRVASVVRDNAGQ